MAERSLDKACLFCRIIRKEIPGDIVRETEELLAFNDINPQAPRHVLIIPKVHIATLNELEPAEAAVIGKMMVLAREIAEDHDFAESGYRIVLNCGKHGGQSVFHIHLHLLAGRHLSWPPG
jgi:histidine triad (HIT) family protein